MPPPAIPQAVPAANPAPPSRTALASTTRLRARQRFWPATTRWRVISTLILATTAAAVICLGVIGNDWINGEQALKLLLAYVASIVYMGTFYCLGVVCTANGLTLSANAAFAAPSIPPGRISVISQSGSAIGALVSRGRARGIGFANLISVGNAQPATLNVNSGRR